MKYINRHTTKGHDKKMLTKVVQSGIGLSYCRRGVVAQEFQDHLGQAVYCQGRGRSVRGERLVSPKESDLSVKISRFYKAGGIAPIHNGAYVCCSITDVWTGYGRTIRRDTPGCPGSL